MHPSFCIFAIKSIAKTTENILWTLMSFCRIADLFQNSYGLFTAHKLNWTPVCQLQLEFQLQLQFANCIVNGRIGIRMLRTYRPLTVLLSLQPINVKYIGLVARNQQTRHVTGGRLVHVSSVQSGSCAVNKSLRLVGLGNTIRMLLCFRCFQVNRSFQ